ncbi:hypothetical protein Pmani_009088 [Petrolisthes manimaculis]|uniref:Tectonic domain-containing protein n=1 Tax=Petrolisthes manimaculis TaxID=1843537 RepID=A0AAE1Q465_9EUCA|nr:hypothetical protein Pmani_009088 [Petrolisthes manimaculis]
MMVYVREGLLHLQLLLLISDGMCEQLAINWSDVNPSITNLPLPILHPAVVPLAPCTCDLTPTLCDLYCCCDEDCSTYEREAVSCSEDVPATMLPHQSCQYQGPYSSEWQDFLCVVSEKSPYLGLFFPHVPHIRNIQTYLGKISQVESSFEDTIPHFPDPIFHDYYLLGSPVATIWPSSESEYRSVLSLPQQLLNGVCVSTIPIYFLKEFSVKCPLQLSPAVCEKEKLLRVTTYLHDSDTILSDPYLEGTQVIANLKNLNTVNTSVIYKCIQSDTAGFVKLQHPYKSRHKQNLDFWKESEFSARSDMKTSSDRECEGYFHLHYNSQSEVCENVVLGVEYRFDWRGPSITRVEAIITIGNIPVLIKPSITMNTNKPSLVRDQFRWKRDLKFPTSFASSRLSLIQHFSVSFQHMGSQDNASHISLQDSDMENDEVNVSHNNTEESDIIHEWNAMEVNLTQTGDDLGLEDVREKSGNPGYQLDKPLITGYMMYSTTLGDNTTFDDNMTTSNNMSTSEEFSYIAVNTNTGLYIWLPDTSGECHEDNIERVTFGMDMMSECWYHWSDIHTCQQLSERLKDVLSSLVRADVVAKMGSPNITVQMDFLPVLFDNGEVVNECGGETVRDEKNSNETIITEPESSDEETGNIQIVSIEAEHDENLNKEAEYNERTSCALNSRKTMEGDIGGEMCQVPNMLEYNVLYEKGTHPLVGTYPVYQVVGVVIRYQYQDIFMTEGSNEGGISLTSSVIFSLVTAPSQLSRFWEKMEDQWCQGGTCWQEILGPWTHPHSSTTLLIVLANTFILATLAVPVLVVVFCHSG